MIKCGMETLVFGSNSKAFTVLT